MLITRETDYALRILRTLSDGKSYTAGELAERESLPQKFAYKILKKLEKAGMSGGGGTARPAPSIHNWQKYRMQLIRNSAPGACTGS